VVVLGSELPGGDLYISEWYPGIEGGGDSVADSVWIFGRPNVLSRRVFEQPVEHGDAEKARHRGQAPANGGSSQSPVFHGPRPQLHVPTLYGEDLEVHLGAPREELA